MTDETGSRSRNTGNPPHFNRLAMAETAVTYQLTIRLTKDIHIAIGALGTHRLPAGDYVYTGSARRNLEARIARHCRRNKKLHWHIDYLLAAAEARIVDIRRLVQAECAVNHN